MSLDDLYAKRFAKFDEIKACIARQLGRAPSEVEEEAEQACEG